MILSGTSESHLTNNTGIDQTVAVVNFNEDAALVIMYHFWAQIVHLCWSFVQLVVAWIFLSWRWQNSLMRIDNGVFNIYMLFAFMIERFGVIADVKLHSRLCFAIKSTEYRRFTRVLVLCSVTSCWVTLSCSQPTCTFIPDLIKKWSRFRFVVAEFNSLLTVIKFLRRIHELLLEMALIEFSVLVHASKFLEVSFRIIFLSDCLSQAKDLRVVL